jgi:NAD(P)-dependent dehydrogenase (short-subunit alcohol dehydrogenase family)
MTQNFWSGTAVVTGAGSGLGAALAERFAAEGMAVMVLDIDGERAEQTAQAVRNAGGTAKAVQLDVANRAAVEAAARLTLEAFGSCNVLCANVGVQQFGAVERLTEQDWKWVLDVNVMGVVRTVDAFLPLIRATPGARRIALTSSSAALVPGVRLAAYTASKFAVMGYGETLRLELAPEDIGVSILFPAGMRTRHLESSARARPSDIGQWTMMPDDIKAMKESRKLDEAAHVVTAEHATRNLLQELAENRRYIVTHGNYRDAFVERFDDILAALDRAHE